VSQASPPAGGEDDCAEYSDRFLAGYDRGRLLGRGACAVVWLAAPSGGGGASAPGGGVVAIKQVAKGTTGKKRSDTEAARKEVFFGSYFFGPGGEPKLAPARHPGIHHIAKLLDHAETKRDIWLVMEYGGTSLTKMVYEIKGEFLRGERLYRVNHLPVLQSMKQNPAVLKSILRQLLSALCIFADHHIVHSDIKPDNILVEEDERHQLKVRFIDLGSAFTFDCPESLALATPEYMPPEALETCIARNPLTGVGGGCRHSFGRLGSGGASLGGPRRGGGAAAPAVDPAQKLKLQAQPWSFDTWSLGSILLELSLGTPLWLSYKCRVADDQRANSAATGLFAVPGRDPEKIMLKQQDALCQRGLHNVLRNAAGVPLDGNGRDLLAAMLAWDPLDRISPHEALRHPWFTHDGAGTY
jgi:serine/threonine protein kinase